ncbi:hypothetical protein ABL78_1203 [Leptomonas seymouri]|uniref:J domain-containing protein n=1 Tax=Leptomonas seymouri TaxID=5684 RepID=A0A0N1I106_LEPSE|nr:hypothetical protein ABL78_1203 [Leptomonas seymouri]|eukprot:KPI89710.1 hypothetical protein ABL78_1203 [Leptomonas seymouri]
MRRLLRCRAHTWPSSFSVMPLHPLTLSRRQCATTPTEDDVLAAYRTLGVHATATLADVKKRYGVLAKEHHPDVSSSTATSSTSRMTDINAAYNTVKQFFQAGGRLSSRPSFSSSTSSSEGKTSSPYYSAHDTAYQPWYEDMDPLMYELMWEEMRRQNEEEAFSNTVHAENFYRMSGQWRPPRSSFSNGRSSKQRPPSPGHGGSDRTNAQNASGSNRAASKTTTWSEEQLKAMVHMYQDGKSFEFIANALGKASADAVMEEFNRWSADTHSSRRRSDSNRNSRQGSNGRRRRSPNRSRDFYYAESPDDIPYELYEMMEEEPYCDGSGAGMGNPFGYCQGDGDGYNTYYGNATPFYGTHQMSSGGAPPFPRGSYPKGSGRQRVYDSSHNASYKPSRHHRNGPPHKSKRKSDNGSSSGGDQNGDN